MAASSSRESYTDLKHSLSDRSRPAPSPASSRLAAIGILERRTVVGIAAPCPGTSSIWQAGFQLTLIGTCSNDDEAREHGSFIAHRVGTEKPDMVHQENFILVTNETDDELFRIPIASS